MKILEMQHVGIITGNFAASLAFYRDILGFKEVRHTDWGDYLQVAVEAPDGTQIELSDFGLRSQRAQQDREAVGYRHIALQVDDVDEWAGYLEGQGVHIALEPEDFPIIRSRCMLCHDPDGVEIELFRYLDQA